ncbi:MAG TPA: ATPase domain-containing protein [Terriglobales bacterium]|nr:ATPase domain-containing protein [Terriglobales bacterium]
MSTTSTATYHRPAAEPKRISTGVKGLDEILQGGIPTNHIYLVAGDPGTGKTTMGLQFLLAGVTQGETVLLIALSETRTEISSVATSHGWSVEGINIYELGKDEQGLGPEGQYTVFHPAEVELTETTKAIMEYVERVNPSRIVIDSLSELRMLARDALRYRREVLWLKQFFGQRDCTVLFLDDKTSERYDLQLQSIAHGVVMLEQMPREYGAKRRRMEIVKLRGARFRDGYHDYNISTGGLDIFPRIQPHVSSEFEGAEAPILKSGIDELDNLLGGGVHVGTSSLIAGPAGCGKSTIATRYAVTAAERGERVSFYIFDESIQTLMIRSRDLGIPLDQYVKNGRIVVQSIDPAELSPGEFAHRVRTGVEGGARMVIIDSLNGYMNSMPGEGFLIAHMHELLSYLHGKQVSTLLILAQHGFVGSNMVTPVDVSYLADNVVLLRYFEASGEVRQAISVVKRRSGGHERTIRELRLGEKQVRIGRALSDFRGVLTGVPTYVGKSSLLEGPGDD